MKTCVPLSRGKRWLFLTLLAVGICPRAFAADLLVYNNNNSGAGSLRQAIADNNGLGGGNTIVFSNVVTGTITLFSELVISTNVTILGPGPNLLAISGNNNSRVFQISGNNTVANISGLTITNGFAYYGGGIWNLGAVLNATNCTVRGNIASSPVSVVVGGGGISSSGTTTLIGCTVSGNTAGSGVGVEGAFVDGGGISASGTTTLIGCTVSGNSAVAFDGSSSGGGIYQDGTLTMIASTVSSNSARYGGGISSFGTTIMSNCTASGNSAGFGGGIYNGSSLTVIASTFSGNLVSPSSTNAANIYNTSGGTVEIGNTILNTDVTRPNLFNQGAVTSRGYNLSSDTSGSGVLIAVGDQNNTNPNLGPLQNNGGPTWTMKPLPGSPAIDKGKSLGVTTDQRGAPRPYDFSSVTNASGGDGSDIGAFELGRPTLNIQKFNTNAVLSWQSYYGDFTLQSVTNVIASNSWATVAETPVVVANQYVLTNGPISGNKFYRLKGN